LVKYRTSGVFKRALGEDSYPAELILSDAVIEAIIVVHTRKIHTRDGLLSTVGSSSGSDFDVRFARGVLAAIVSFSLHAKIHKSEWQPAHRAAVAAARAQKAAAKAKKSQGHKDESSDDDDIEDDDDDEDSSSGDESEAEGALDLEATQASQGLSKFPRLVIRGPRLA
jgi:ribosomal protein L12E/L44/L45/RPP1/RPP2